MLTDWGFPGVGNSEFICLGLPDKQGFCLKSGCVICFTVWEEAAAWQEAGCQALECALGRQAGGTFLVMGRQVGEGKG